MSSAHGQGKLRPDRRHVAASAAAGAHAPYPPHNCTLPAPPPPCSYLDHNLLSGTLPDEWGSPETFQQLNTL